MYYVKNPNEWKKLEQDVANAMSEDEGLESAVKVLQGRGGIDSKKSGMYFAVCYFNICPYSL